MCLNGDFWDSEGFLGLCEEEILLATQQIVGKTSHKSFLILQNPNSDILSPAAQRFEHVLKVQEVQLLGEVEGDSEPRAEEDDRPDSP